MKKFITFVALLLVLSLSGCRYANLNSLWGEPKPCIVTTTLCGPTEGDIASAAQALLKGSYASKGMDAFINTLTLTAEQVQAWQVVKEADKQTDRWVQENLMDLWAQMWWRSEDDNAWRKIGYKNN